MVKMVCFARVGKEVCRLKISMLNDVIGGVLGIERMKWNILRISVASLVLIVKMVCFARVEKKFVRFEDFHVGRFYGRSTADRTRNGTFRGFLSHS